MFDNSLSFVSMGKYTTFVYSAYAIAFIMFYGMWYQSKRALWRVTRAIRAKGAKSQE